ncbi:dTDP-4-dehydrorhamnose reductase [Vibrio neptunius]|uniref:dTDP-4-dehydrorhamnose reductase n=1 Tax=Vibrio neptunius TaxID=170651 RepID=UPI0033160E72
MKVLITGSNGQVGHLLKQKLSQQAELLALDRQQLDITDKIAVDNIVSKFQPDYIINAAAYTAVDKAETEKELSFSINRDGPLYLAQAAETHDAVMLHISTDYVFDGQGNMPYSELDSTSPMSVYGDSKLSGEHAVTLACKRYLVLRTSWVFGEYGTNFVKTMLRLGGERDSLNIVADQFGGPTYAGDIADALVSMIKHIENGGNTEWGIYHFSGAPHVSWFDFATAIFAEAENAKVLAKQPQLSAISSSEFPTPAKRPANSRLNCKKIETQFGINESDWRKALKKIKAYV